MCYASFVCVCVCVDGLWSFLPMRNRVEGHLACYCNTQVETERVKAENHHWTDPNPSLLNWRQGCTDMKVCVLISLLWPITNIYWFYVFCFPFVAKSSSPLHPETNGNKMKMNIRHWTFHKHGWHEDADILQITRFYKDQLRRNELDSSR